MADTTTRRRQFAILRDFIKHRVIDFDYSHQPLTALWVVMTAIDDNATLAEVCRTTHADVLRYGLRSLGHSRFFMIPLENVGRYFHDHGCHHLERAYNREWFAWQLSGHGGHPVLVDTATATAEDNDARLLYDSLENNVLEHHGQLELAAILPGIKTARTDANVTVPVWDLERKIAKLFSGKGDHVNRARLSIVSRLFTTRMPPCIDFFDAAAAGDAAALTAAPAKFEEIGISGDQSIVGGTKSIDGYYQFVGDISHPLHHCQRYYGADIFGYGGPKSDATERLLDVPEYEQMLENRWSNFDTVMTYDETFKRYDYIFAEPNCAAVPWFEKLSAAAQHTERDTPGSDADAVYAYVSIDGRSRWIPLEKEKVRDFSDGGSDLQYGTDVSDDGSSDYYGTDSDSDSDSGSLERRYFHRSFIPYPYTDRYGYDHTPYDNLEQLLRTFDPDYELIVTGATTTTTTADDDSSAAGDVDHLNHPAVIDSDSGSSSDA